MSKIGHFTTQRDGFVGTIRTATLSVKVKLVPNEKNNDKAPDYRLLTTAGYEFGAAWKKVSQNDRNYLSVNMDDPIFPATVYARLIESEDGTHSLLWSRPA